MKASMQATAPADALGVAADASSDPPGGNAPATHKTHQQAPKGPGPRDLSKLDDFGLRLGSHKSQAAAMYARKTGATLAEVKAQVGSIQFNVLTNLERKGYRIKRVEEAGTGGRKATRYFLEGK